MTDISGTGTAGPETKVRNGTGAAYAAGAALLEILMLVNGRNDLIGFLPDAAEALILPAIPAGVAYLTMYLTRHRAGRMSPSAVEAVIDGSARPGRGL